MDHVPLIEGGTPRDALEQESDEGQVVLPRQLGIDSLESAGIVGAQVGRRAHPDQHDGGFGRLLSGLVDDGLDVGSE